MQFLDRIKAIESRAGVVNLSLFQLCREAGVDYVRVYRWKTGENSPTVNLLERHLGALERKLTELEERMREALALASSVPSENHAA